MAHPISITHESGTRVVDAHWTNGILAITPHVGSTFPSGGGMDAREGHWTVTHVRTGFALSGLIPDATRTDPEALVPFCEALTLAAPWHVLDADEAMNNEALRAGIVKAAREFWGIDREREG